MLSIKTRWNGAMMVIAGAVGFAGAACANTVVISASGPSARSYPAGRSLAPGSAIVLKAGDTLTVLDSRGTRTLRGPARVSAEASATAASTSFASLVATQNRRRARTGAIRGTGERARPSNLWSIDITGGGTVCVADPAAMQLWRPDMQQPATLTVTAEHGGSAQTDFAKGRNTAAWPAALPIAEGRSYVLSGGGLARPTHLRFAMLDTPAADPAGTYTALDAKGCEAQKQLLLTTMRAD
jgi:hypothetical protein